ncbi:MAG: MurR/RpiR family transcriptional regulator [Clostridia bacterium]|nr:MurR/RpiR family transcriptional regulator [Clostridia bacterium]MBQ8859646.1 MurR/RpiR family transcriptional regulator [Clostridia bacterium]
MENDIESRIRAKESEFSKGQKKIASAILENYDKAAYMTAARLGEMVSVSESTVVRFAIELGYAGYPELQHAVQELVRAKLTSNQRIQVSNLRLGDGDVLDSVLAADMAKIKYTLENINRDSFERAVDALCAARRVYILGVRSSASLASFLSFNLGLVFDNVRFIQPTSSGEVFEQMLDIGAGDVVFAISFPRYSTKLINAVKYAHAQGASVISLTDSVMSPIAAPADAVLTAQSDMASYVDSLVAPLSIINAVLVAITKKTQDQITARFDKLEKIWDEYDVYAKR